MNAVAVAPAAPEHCYTFVSDLGHSWLSVPLAEIVTLKLMDRISAGSHIDPAPGEPVLWLEEDRDLELYLKTRFAHCTDPDAVHRFRRSWPRMEVDRADIRDMPYYMRAGRR